MDVHSAASLLGEVFSEVTLAAHPLYNLE